MTTFTATKTYTFKDLVRQLSFTMLIVAIIYAALLAWWPERLTVFSLGLPAFLLLKDLYDKASSKRLQRLSFDTDKKEIVIFFKSLLSEVKQIQLSFDTARLELVDNKGKLRLFEPLELYILKGKTEVFELTKTKDGLSTDTLQEIVRTAEQHAILIVQA